MIDWSIDFFDFKNRIGRFCQYPVECILDDAALPFKYLCQYKTSSCAVSLKEAFAQHSRYFYKCYVKLLLLWSVLPVRWTFLFEFHMLLCKDEKHRKYLVKSFRQSGKLIWQHRRRPEGKTWWASTLPTPQCSEIIGY